MTREVIDRSIDGLLNPQDPTIVSSNDKAGNKPTAANTDSKKVIKAEYAKFEKYAIARLDRTNKRDFSSELIEPEMLKTLNTVVSSCTTSDDIKLIFSKLKGVTE